LDGGCAHGWFLDEAAAAGATTIDVEPDEGVAAVQRARAGLRGGYFPDAIGADEPSTSSLSTTSSSTSRTCAARSTPAAAA
jgi:hypothetical protein